MQKSKWICHNELSKFRKVLSTQGSIQDDEDPYVVNCTEVEQDKGVLANHLGTCTICREDITIGKWYKTLLNCGHSFHDICIDQWIIVEGEKCSLVNEVLQQSKCPVCRAGIFASNKTESVRLSV